MEEAQQLADRVVVLAGGRVVAEGTPDSLGAPRAGEAVVSFRAGRPRRALPHRHPDRRPAPLLSAAAARGEELEGLTVTRPTLEDVYLQLTEEPA